MSETKSFDQWLEYIKTVYLQKIDLSLSRIKKVQEKMQLYKPAPFVFMIAGTNGKGTTAHVLSHLLLSHGLSVATYTSPHLMCFTERLCINMQKLSKQLWCEAFTAVDSAAENITLTFFEYTTLAAFYLIKKTATEVAVLEVGLGGRQDAVNCVVPDVSIITSIGYDHQNYLGNTLEKIAYEKAGIMRANKITILGATPVNIVFEKLAQELPTKLLQYKKDFDIKITDTDTNSSLANECVETKHSFKNVSFNTSSNRISVNDLAKPITYNFNMQTINLKFSLQSNLITSNLALALAAFYSSNLVNTETEKILSAFKKIHLIGRQNIYFLTPNNQKCYILDVAHNADGVEQLAKMLNKVDSKKLIAVFAAMEDKDIEKMLSLTKSLFHKWFVCELNQQRSATIRVLVKYFENLGIKKVSFFTCFNELWNSLHQKKDVDECIVVFGSFHTVQAAIQSLKEMGCELTV